MALTIQAAAKLALKHLRGIGFNPETNVVEEFINTGIFEIQGKILWVANMRSLRRAGIKVNKFWFTNPEKNVPPYISPLNGKSTKIDFTLIPTKDKLYILPYEKIRTFALELEKDLPKWFQQSTWGIEIDDKNDSFKWAGGNTKSFPLYVVSSTPELYRLISPVVFQYAVDISDDTPGRTEQVVSRIIRDSKLAREIKELYSYRCQLCETALDIGQGTYYAEAHHLRPLGQPHNGPDVKENIICVCPNHHALLDFGAIRLDRKTLGIDDSHGLSNDYIEYHNNVCCLRQE
ncbi:MAG: hypothetical protein GX895_15010 [Clostridiales bacterium]|nr:hypothetical protein [Clostridiales bacterium]